MNCAEAKELINAYIDGELDQLESKRLQHHLLECPTCAYQMKTLKKTAELVRSLKAIEPPLDLHSSVRRKLEEERGARGSPFKNFINSLYRVPIRGVATAAVVILIFLTVRFVWYNYLGVEKVGEKLPLSAGELSVKEERAEGLTQIEAEMEPSPPVKRDIKLDKTYYPSPVAEAETTQETEEKEKAKSTEMEEIPKVAEIPQSFSFEAGEEESRELSAKAPPIEDEKIEASAILPEAPEEEYGERDKLGRSASPEQKTDHIYLRLETDDFQGSKQELIAISKEFKGDITDFSSWENEQGQKRGWMLISLPDPQLYEAVAHIEKLGKVKHELKTKERAEEAQAKKELEDILERGKEEKKAFIRVELIEISNQAESR